MTGAINCTCTRAGRPARRAWLGAFAVTAFHAFGHRTRRERNSEVVQRKLNETKSYRVGPHKGCELEIWGWFTPAAEWRRGRLRGANDVKAFGFVGRSFRRDSPSRFNADRKCRMSCRHVNENGPIQSVSYTTLREYRHQVTAEVIFTAVHFLFNRPTPLSIGYPIPIQEAGDALVTPVGSRVTMGNGDHQLSGGACMLVCL
ncbi:hypothetical protein EVAR_7942_1 [Eumeta japonica]|uniref:Uncharacterized protein n=1 Tax=Eumeta variegata TaxID=151549 RepID=A0A4C1TGS5_EUMVA|nr:hypothetical protein EVAR_7942_1 [Eumeta japonica]